MYKLRSVHNSEILEDVHYKLQKRIDLIDSINDKFDKIESLGGKYSDAITFGTKENIKTIKGAGVIPLAPIAIGVGTAAIGLIMMIPSSVPDPDFTIAQLEAAGQMYNVGRSLIDFGGNAFGVGIKLSAIPATVATVSISKKIARILSGKFNEKTQKRLIDSQRIVDLIDCVNENSDDPSIAFAKKFLYRVDLSKNSKDFNMELLNYLAYHRTCFQREEKGLNKDDELNESFEDFIKFLESSQHRMIGVSKSFKENKLVNELIDEFYNERKSNCDISKQDGIQRI